MTTENDNEEIETKSDKPWISWTDILWATSPIYKILLVAFVLHSLFDGRRTDSPLMIIIYIALGLLAVAQILGVIAFFIRIKKK